MVDELKKAKHTHTKNLERYLKLVQDTEQTIKTKDAAVAATMNEHESADKDSTKDDSFVNRSINKVIFWCIFSSYSITLLGI